MKYFFSQRKRGFTLVEIIIVIAIIGLLTAVILGAVTQARTSARDKARMADIDQLELVFKLYLEAFNEYPSDSVYDSGAEIGVGGDIDADLASIDAIAPVDPKRDGSTYQYIYDTDFNCTASGQTVVYAKNLEKISDANANDVCTGGSTEASGNEYIILLE